MHITILLCRYHPPPAAPLEAAEWPGPTILSCHSRSMFRMFEQMKTRTVQGLRICCSQGWSNRSSA